MKNKLKNVGVITFGLAVALVISPMDADASEDDLMVDVNVLNKVDGKSSVLDVEISDVPIVGDVNVNIPSDPEAADSEAVATVEISDSVVDELDVSVLEKTETKDSVATVELESPLTDDVMVDVVSGEKTSSTFDGGVVEVNAEDLPLLGETHVGVLDRHTAEEDGKSFSAGVIQANLDGGVLDDTSIDVLAVEKAEDESEERETSAAVDVAVDKDDGLLDDLGVSVLKREESETGMKSSLASVDLETPVTDELDVDVALLDRTWDTFDGGLVEVNAENLPLLGETHVGVLDRHMTAEEEEGKSFSAGLIQADLDEGLLEDTSVGVLVRKMTTTEDGRWVSDSGASLDVGLSGTETVSADLLTRERFVPAAQLDAPTEVVPPAVDEGTGDGTSAPEEDGIMPAIPENTDEGTSAGVDEEDQGTVMPPATEGGSGADDSTSDGNQGTIAPPVNDGESMEEDAGVPGAMDEAGSESAADNGWSGDVDADFGSRTGELSGMADASVISGVGQSSVMNGFAMNNADPRSSLPKTGGFWDGKRLAFLALFLVVAGFGLRRLGKSTRLAA